MCIWVAYTGKKQAGEVLHRMIRRSEGVWGGWFSGIVTNDNGKLYTAKTAGCVRVWNEKFKVSDFPGNTGLFHARTPSHDDGAWSHPFGTARMMSAEQGGFACYATEACYAKYSQRAAELVNAGYEFPSATTRHQEWPKQVKLPDGRPVHSSELCALSIDFEYQKCHDPYEALRRGLGFQPIEAVIPAIFADRPGKIYIANFNQNIVVTREEDGFCLSTVTLSFANPAAPDIFTLPVNSITEVSPDGIKIEEFLSGLSVDCATPPHFMERAAAWWIGKKGAFIDDYWREFVEKEWPQEPEKPTAKAIAAYQVLERLVIEGKLKPRTVPVKGFTDDFCERFTFDWQD